MASEFAVALSKKPTHDVPDHIVQWGQGVIDAELAEVREVLDTTKRRLLPDGPCWCRTFMPTLGHTEDCQRARALYEKLVIK